MGDKGAYFHIHIWQNKAGPKVFPNVNPSTFGTRFTFGLERTADFSNTTSKYSQLG